MDILKKKVSPSLNTGWHKILSGEPEPSSVLCEPFVSWLNYFNIKNSHSLFDRTDAAEIMVIPLILATALNYSVI
jgi:hypothetical protein